jgi:uncharacterized membrane protein YccC
MTRAPTSRISDSDLDTALASAGVSPEVADAVLAENRQARIDGLKAAIAVLTLFAIVSLFFTGNIPTKQPGASGEIPPEDDEET